MKVGSVALLIALGGAAAPRIQAAQQLVGIDLFSGKLYSIEVRTGQASLLSGTGLNFFIWAALAKDSTGRLFGAYVDNRGVTGTWIYEIDPNTGQATLAAFTTLAGITAMSFGVNDELYVGHDRFPGLGGSPVDFYEVELPTGVATLIGDMNSTGIGALDFDGSQMWAYDYARGLVKVDTASGQTTDVNLNFSGVPDLAESICFGDDGILYQVDAALWIQDTLTGVPAMVNLTGYSGILIGIEYLPGPATPFTLGTQGETGGNMAAQVWGATPHGTVVLLRAQGGGGPTPVPGGNPCAGTLLDLNSTLAPLAVVRADAAGRARLGPAFVPASVAGPTRLQALDLATCAVSNPLRIIY